ncbi:hypothetical protein FB192DRAFT_1374142 [Mucor lusitanicus]|uniref:Secreted protein n=1 Tax=Mucor circinelloides f. lusitanicus TaxID=29924 RepID=A0A8H4BGH5_MUCCL|nr:hypothetical protein FB192DRAFT_1374142 [Mucor lusitanicus]
MGVWMRMLLCLWATSQCVRSSSFVLSWEKSQKNNNKHFHKIRNGDVHFQGHESTHHISTLKMIHLVVNKETRYKKRKSAAGCFWLLLISPSLFLTF